MTKKTWSKTSSEVDGNYKFEELCLKYLKKSAARVFHKCKSNERDTASQ